MAVYSEDSQLETSREWGGFSHPLQRGRTPRRSTAPRTRNLYSREENLSKIPLIATLQLQHSPIYVQDKITLLLPPPPLPGTTFFYFFFYSTPPNMTLLVTKNRPNPTSRLLPPATTQFGNHFLFDVPLGLGVQFVRKPFISILVGVDVKVCGSASRSRSRSSASFLHAADVDVVSDGALVEIVTLLVAVVAARRRLFLLWGLLVDDDRRRRAG